MQLHYRECHYIMGHQYLNKSVSELIRLIYSYVLNTVKFTCLQSTVCVYCDDRIYTLPVVTSCAITLPLLQMFSTLCDRQYDLWTRQRVSDITIDEQDSYNLSRHTVCQSGTF